MEDPAKLLKNLKLYFHFYQKNGSGGSRFSQNEIVQYFYFYCQFEQVTHLHIQVTQS